MDNRELCVLISVYNAFDIPRFPDAYPGRLAMNIKSLWSNSNILDKGYPIYVQMDNIAHDKCWGNLAAIGFPEENILRFESPPTELKSRVLGQHYYVFSRPELSEFKRILVWDVDLFVLKTESSPRFDMDVFLTDKIALHFASKKANYRCNDESDFHQWLKYEKSDDYSECYRKTKQRINEIYPNLVNSEARYYMVRAAYTVYPREYTQQGFEEFAVRLAPVVGDDELILQLWLAYSGDDTYERLGLMEFVEAYDGDIGKCLKDVKRVLHNSEKVPLLVHYKLDEDNTGLGEDALMDEFYRRMGGTICGE